MLLFPGPLGELLFHIPDNCILHSLSQLHFFAFLLPGMPPSPPVTPRPILWAPPVETLLFLQSKIPAISTDQPSPVLSRDPQVLLCGTARWVLAQCAHIEHSLWPRLQEKCAGHKDISTATFPFEDTPFHSDKLSWKPLDCENYVLLSSVSPKEPSAHLDI